jgi:hypothetical protein
MVRRSLCKYGCQRRIFKAYLGTCVSYGFACRSLLLKPPPHIVREEVIYRVMLGSKESCVPTSFARDEAGFAMGVIAKLLQR